MTTPLTKLQILSLDAKDPKEGKGDGFVTVTAQFNPKEIQIDKQVSWSKHQGKQGDAADLEFTGGEGRSMSFELVFDGYETNESVAPQMAQLMKLITPRSASKDEKEAEHLRRPPTVGVSWATNQLLVGVIESISTKYTMFSPEGQPLRCTVNLKFKEATKPVTAKSTAPAPAKP